MINRFIARILGTDVDRDYILQRLTDKDYSDIIREKVLDVIQTSSIDKFARSVNLSLGEAWEVYRHIKDIVIDSEVIGMISRLQIFRRNRRRKSFEISSKTTKLSTIKSCCRIIWFNTKNI